MYSVRGRKNKMFKLIEKGDLRSMRGFSSFLREQKNTHMEHL